MTYLLFLLDIKQVKPFFDTLVRYGPMEKQEILLKNRTILYTKLDIAIDIVPEEPKA